MRGGLWLIRLLLLVAVSAVVFSPLVVHGEASTPRVPDFQYDVSALALPSSPTYPVVTTYREVRLALAEGRCEKARVSISFASNDVAAIIELASRQDYTRAVQHAATYRENFDRSVGWTVVEGQSGTNISSLLAQLKNEHLAQQEMLAQACVIVPSWAVDGLDTARRHAAAVLIEAIEVLETAEQAELYRASIAQMHPDIVPQQESVPETSEAEQTQEPSPAVTDEAPAFDAQVQVTEESVDTPQPDSQSAPDIASMSVRPSTIPPGGTCRISCNAASDSADLLQYTWMCRKGRLDPGGPHAEWTAPDAEGTYQVSVVVTDQQGNSDTASIQVHVRNSSDDPPDADDITPAPTNPQPAPSAAPDILGIDVTADHKYLEKSLAGYAILVSRSCTITCAVDDPDAVTFHWSANAGTFTGEGDTVIWNAPQAVGNFKVTVVVTNSEGQEDTEVIEFHCTTCSQCF